MALNLSTLTSPATSDDVLAEVLTTADFLEPVPVLRNLARGSNKGGDAKQAVALNQPKALPLIDGDGYLYCPPISQNYAYIPDEQASNLEGFNDFTFEIDVALADWTPSANQYFFSKYASWGNGYQFFIRTDGRIEVGAYYAGSFSSTRSSAVNFRDGQRVSLRVKRVGTNIYFEADEGAGFYSIGSSTTPAGSIDTSTTRFQISGWHVTAGLISGAVFGVKIWEDSTQTSKVLDVDFTSTNVRHNDTKFQCATGQTVTINQSGNDPATIIKKPVLRFDGVDDFMNGVFDQTITDGYMFAAFSVLGAGGENHGRIFGGSTLAGTTLEAGGFAIRRNAGTSQVQLKYNTNTRNIHSDVFNGARGDLLYESKLEDADQQSQINNADADVGNSTFSSVLASEKFVIAGATTGIQNSAIDLEYLALFPATITDAQADDVRKYINNRNNVFYRWDTDGYYFYNPQDLSSGAVTTWNGRIVGSDNGDADKNATQSTSADQPTSDGYKVTFADNTDHFDIPSTTQAGWQVVGTSLGTFAYKVDSDAVTELNLLGNLGNTSYRQAGDLYGIILLPESATGREINEAKKLLTDRGASVSATAAVRNAWHTRSDIVQFDGGDMSGVTDAYGAWRFSSSLTSFSTDLPSVTDVSFAWYSCSSLESFSTELPSVNKVAQAWQNCLSLTSFNVELPLATNAAYAWRNCSSLTSFSTSLPLVTDALQAWRDCSSLTSFSSDLSLATGVSSAWRDCSSLESFSTALPSATSANYAWYRCTSLTSFSSTLPSVTNLYQAWQGCTSLTDFSSDVFSNWNPSIISSGVFDTAWVNCPLTAQSVENILTSIDASGKYATSTGLSGGTALADAGIDIDYDVSTGSLSAATNAAIRSLDTKGWEVYINGEIRTGVELLDLQGFYFFESEGLAAANVTSWDSSIGTSSASLDLVGTQTDANDQPVADGTVVTFADNTDHFDIPSTTQAGWQVVGTSLGTFAYKVNANAVTELNLLGNLGGASHRKAGDLYGIILLPESATGRDIDEARKLLIDRGAADGVTVTDLQDYFRNRRDIVEFKSIDTSQVTSFFRTWNGADSLTSFPLIDTSSALIMRQSFQSAANLSSFPAIQAPNCSDFRNTWQNCSALTSFPEDAKLGTEASNVNFSQAWQNSGLTSFSTPLPTATNANFAWKDCSSLTSINTELPLATYAYAGWYECSSLESFNTPLPLVRDASLAWYNCSAITSFSTELPSVTNVTQAWYQCSSLESFSSELPSVTNVTNAWRLCASLTSFSSELPSVTNAYAAWRDCSSLTDFSADVFANWNPASISSGVFDYTWDGCTSLTAQSVENILTSIDASGKYATSDGTSGGTALANAGIDIDYNGDPLSAATTAAIDSLSGKGWQVYINGELVIPNILDLQPAAAYSLRSFDADADPNVVNVRRSSDGAISDFTASEVSDGTLTSWVNTEYNRYTSDFSSGVDGWSSYNGTTTPNVDSIGGRDDCLRFVIDETNSYHFVYKTQQLLTYDRYRLSAEVYLPSSNTQIDEVKVLNGIGDFVNIDGSNSITSTDEWVTVSFEATRNSGANGHRMDFVAYTNGDNLYAGNGTDTFYVRNIQIDQLTADGHVTTWYDQRQIVETGDAYGTTISGTVDGSTAVYNQIAPAVAGEFYRVRFTVSNINPRGRIRYRNYAASANITATAGLASMTYFSGNGDYEAYVPSDDGLSLWFYADAGQSFDYSGVSVQQVAEVPNNATQSTASAQPKIVDAGTLVTEGGLAAVDFDGTDDYLQLNNNVFADNFEVAIVSHIGESTSSSFQRLFDISNGIDNELMLVKSRISDGNSLIAKCLSIDPNTEAASLGQNLINDQNLTYVASDVAASSYFGSVDGVVSTISDFSGIGNNDFSRSTIGIRSDLNNDTCSDGTFQEIVLFNTDQSANRTGIENNINDHFDIYS